MGTMSRGTLLPALLVSALSASAAGAELVLLADGEVVKVASFAADGERARLTLPNGGEMTLPMLRIDRVLEDEIEALEAAAPPAVPSKASFPIEYAAEHPIPDVPYGALMYWAAKKHGLNPALVVEVARAESAFNARALSPKGACGLLQIMPATGQRFGLKRAELFDPKKNLEAGARYLRWLLDRFEGDLALALAGYNAGENAVDRYGGVPPYRETRTYLSRIYASLGIPT
jgi:soluble lytic murein transglycosylase-like protein